MVVFECRRHGTQSSNFYPVMELEDIPYPITLRGIKNQLPSMQVKNFKKIQTQGCKWSILSSPGTLSYHFLIQFLNQEYLNLDPTDLENSNTLIHMQQEWSKYNENLHPWISMRQEVSQLALSDFI